MDHREDCCPGAHASRPFVVFHVGDLHLTEAVPKTPPTILRRQRRLVSDLKRILKDIDSLPDKDRFDFVYLPGDIAQNGCAGEYAILDQLLKRHPDLPVRLIPGDHDRQLGSLVDFGGFRASLTGLHRQPATPKANVERDFPTGCPPKMRTPSHTIQQFYFHEDFGSVRCVFLDMVSAGYGRQGFGPDFRLGAVQTEWLADRLKEAEAEGLAVALFTHAYPFDITDKDVAADLAGLIWNSGVRLVEMGHTHYNELAPDGRTLYATARSVGQNEEGPVGYAVVTIDGDAVSWRFRQLQQTWPFVIITSPADRRLATEALAVVGGQTIVRAVAFSDLGAAACCVECRVDRGAWLPMERVGAGCTFQRAVAWPAGSRDVSVRITDGRWAGPWAGPDFMDIDTIRPAAAPPDFEASLLPERLGSDAQALPSWPAKGIRGDQLGPNKLGRKW